MWKFFDLLIYDSTREIYFHLGASLSLILFHLLLESLSFLKILECQKFSPVFFSSFKKKVVLYFFKLYLLFNGFTGKERTFQKRNRFSLNFAEKFPLEEMNLNFLSSNFKSMNDIT